MKLTGVETSDDLAAFVANLLYTVPDMAGMYRSYLSCPPGAVDKLFWIVLLDEEWVLEYQPRSGGGWRIAYQQFCDMLDIMSDKWGLPKGLRGDLQHRKQCLMEYFNKVTTQCGGADAAVGAAGSGTKRRNRKTKARSK